MKTIFTITILLVAFSSTAFSANYEETMKTNIDKLNKASNAITLSELAANFQRVANAEKNKWLPGYYAAYCYALGTAIGEMKADDKHKMLDLAQAQIDVLIKTNKTESEIYALQAFIYQMRITDMMKGMKYSGMANDMLEEAEKLNPNNPRVYYLHGTNTFHTPKAFGGGKEKAKPLFAKAAALFETQKPVNAIEPAWGKQHNAQMLAECNKADE